MGLRSTWAILILLILTIIAHAHPPTGIVVDTGGNVYFTDLETIWKLDTKNTLQIVREGVRGRHVHELTIDKAGNLYGADINFENQRWISDVWKISPDGQLTYLIEPTSTPPRGAGIWIDDKGNMLSVEQDNRTKRQTLILLRRPDGTVTTLAGSVYGQVDGKGSGARFGSVGGMSFGPDGSLYLTDGTTLRRVTMDGSVSTLARDLTKRTSEDRPMLFGNNEGILTALSVDQSGAIYLADAGNQRLLKVTKDGKAEVVYRGEPPYYPNGVFVGGSGDLYVLEVGYQPPSTWLTPRVRKITADGKSSIIAVAGKETSGNSSRSDGRVQSTGSSQLSTWMLVAVPSAVMIVGIAFIACQRRRKPEVLK